MLAGRAMKIWCVLDLPPVLRSATLIQTRVDPADTGAKGHDVTAARLARLETVLHAPVMVAHRIDSLAQALRDAQGALLLILTLLRRR